MKNKVSILLAMFICPVALILSCDPVEPSTYTENFYRIASVQLKDGKASLLIDYTGEKYNISNFKTEADMKRFEVEDGDRVLANLMVSAVGSIASNEITLENIYKLPVSRLSTERPSDTLNYDYQFNVLYLTDIKYPAIWSQGHFVNIAPIYYVPSETSKAEFHLYPTHVSKDTLIMRLYSDIPDNDLAIRGYASHSQSMLCYDISSLTDSVTDAVEQAHRRSLIQELTALDQDSIMVHIFAPDTLRGTLDATKYLRYPRVSVSIKIPFDF